MTNYQKSNEAAGKTSIICKHCGARQAIYKDREQKCPLCESLNIIPFTDEMYLEAQDFEDEEEVFSKKYSHALERLRQKYVYNDPDFDKEAEIQSEIKHKELMAKNLERYKKHPLHIDCSPRCPNCNSSDFDMVPRKWSLFTGFMTNKVDRVCRRCKKRF